MTKDEIMNMPAGREMDWEIQQNVIQEPLGKFDTYPPPYSTDISAAWEVVELIKNKFNFSVLMYSSDSKWEMAIYIDEKTDESERISTGGETAPLAICRAALLATL